MLYELPLPVVLLTEAGDTVSMNADAQRFWAAASYGGQEPPWGEMLALRLADAHGDESWEKIQAALAPGLLVSLWTRSGDGLPKMVWLHGWRVPYR
ncbi:MAG: hypothetical protein M0Z53_12740 [Thermaerobacter sp.]|nr:hypothetical protein [Thermaerobacter sp.]